MKCVHCHKPLPRSRRARKPYPSIIDLGAIFKCKVLEVHSIECHKKVVSGNNHVIYLWKKALEAQVKFTGGLDWLKDGDDPILVVMDDKPDE